MKYVLYTFIVTFDNFTTVGNTSDFQNLKTFSHFPMMYFKWKGTFPPIKAIIEICKKYDPTVPHDSLHEKIGKTWKKCSF